MQNKHIITIILILLTILTINTVTATNNNTQELSNDNTIEVKPLPNLDDHTEEMEEYKQIYNPYEVNEGETFTRDIGLTHIEIKNTATEKSYHEITYTYKKGEKVISDEWSCGLNLGATNVNRDGLIVCHVLLHGTELIKEREPIYKNVKVNKKVVSHYKKVKKGTYIFKEKTGKHFNIVKDLKKRIKNWDNECCSRNIMKIVDKINVHDYKYKIKIIKKYKNKKKYHPQYLEVLYPVKLKVTMYGKKAVYKTIKVNKKEQTGFNIIDVWHKY